MPTIQEQLFEDFVHFAARQGSGAVYQRDPHQPIPSGCVFVRFRSPGEGLSLPRDRAVSPAGGGIYGVQDVCREP
jgi:hypothetical protein